MLLQDLTYNYLENLYFQDYEKFRSIFCDVLKSIDSYQYDYTTCYCGEDLKILSQQIDYLKSLTDLVVRKYWFLEIIKRFEK